MGFAVIQLENRKRRIIDIGIIHTEPKQDLALKLMDMASDLESLIRTHQPILCGIEKLFFGTNITTAIDVAHGRGVLLHTLTRL